MSKKVPVKKLSAAEKAKAFGLPSLKYVADKTARNRGVLDNWNKNYPELFNIVLLGCAEIFRKELFERANAKKLNFRAEKRT